MKLTPEITNHPVAKAVEPIRKDAIERAEKLALKRLAEVEESLKKCGWDCNQAAPFPYDLPAGSIPRELAADKYHFYTQVTKVISSTGKRGAPVIVQLSKEGCERFVWLQKEKAASRYDSFVAKLVNKIGACDDATLDGNHVWGFSILTVHKGKDVEKWKTQEIVNRSVYGLYFNQWPSRKVK